MPENWGIVRKGAIIHVKTRSRTAKKKSDNRRRASIRGRLNSNKFLKVNRFISLKNLINEESTLKWIRSLIFSQWSDFKTGEI